MFSHNKNATCDDVKGGWVEDWLIADAVDRDDGKRHLAVTHDELPLELERRRGRGAVTCCSRASNAHNR